MPVDATPEMIEELTSIIQNHIDNDSKVVNDDFELSDYDLLPTNTARTMTNIEVAPLYDNNGYVQRTYFDQDENLDHPRNILAYKVSVEFYIEPGSSEYDALQLMRLNLAKATQARIKTRELAYYQEKVSELEAEIQRLTHE